ncbi:hypothetical protein [Flavobacterium quisquiliarum]|uniref:Uncharacterized protein n=1 Tax=Flavobacterium quisquiliarum TaxID=1834436 RepID=A0ABV8WEY1_9FLAO|nr:hypothetical protein [Flavobacterium quisquiliarum]MBW1655698.1 hypothetical protein [Flavobacterium quisquiliarum]NWK99991.1 hypothetical protein [Flavobacterium collinsii]
MKQESQDEGKSYLSILLLLVLVFPSFMAFLFAMEFSDNYKVIKNEKAFRKIKVKIDSTKTSSTRSGKSSSIKSINHYFNKGNVLNHESYESEISEYMSKHNDSLYIWYLDNRLSRFAYENQKSINVSQEIERNNKLKTYIVICILPLLLFLIFRNKL